MKNVLIVGILLLVFVLVCGCNKSEKGKSTELKEKIQEAVLTNNHENAFIVDSAKFELFHSLFIEKNPDFQKGIKRDSTYINRIPVTLLSEVMNEEYDSISDVLSVFSLKMISLNTEKLYFHYKINCMAGGNCARYNIACFTKDRIKIGNENIAYVASDDTESQYVYFNCEDGSLIVSKRFIHYNEDNIVLTDTVKTDVIDINDLF